MDHDMFVCNVVFTFVIGRAWEVACDSRWTHVMKLKKRFLTTCVGNMILPESLKERQVQAALKDDMVKALTQLLEADSGNCSARF